VEKCFSFFRKSGDRAFSLPEVLITVLLISILFSLGIVFTSGLKSTKKMRNYEIAIALAQQAIEVLRAAPFCLIDDEDAKEKSVETDLNTSKGDNDILEPTYSTGGVKYERKVEVTNVPPLIKDGTPVNLKHVRVIVKWVTPDNDKANYEVTTTIADLN